jgi:uncharacterized protein (TIRG00374 family)
MKNVIRYTVSLAIAGGLLWYVFKDIRLDDMAQRLGQADWRLIAISFAVTLAAHLFRTWRWMMLMEPLGYKVPLGDTFLSVLTGYFANYIMPRMGEVTRCGTLYRLQNVPVNQSFGTVVAERIFDVVTLLILIGLNFLLEFGRLKEFFLDFFGNKLGDDLTGKLLALSGVLLIGLGIVVYMIKNKAVRDRLLKHGLVQKIVNFAQGMLEGLLTIRKLKNPGLFILSTVLIWICYYFASYVLFFCLPETAGLGPLAGLTLLVIGAIGMTAPTQGGIGAYHLLVGNVMVLYGITHADGITLATFVHGSQMILMLAAGAIAFILVLLKNRKSVKAAEV